MSKVEIYTKGYCPYCLRAKQLLKSKNVKFTEIDLDDEPRRIGEMMERAQGRRTVPQIFINGLGVGGSDDLHALDRKGKLDKLLKGET